MERYAIPFAQLIDREAADLTADERESLEYYYAALNLAEGVSADSAARRWCEMATTVGRIAYMLDRVPKTGDPGTNAAILDWLHAQQGAGLNSYQRARLRSLPGGAELVSDLSSA